MSLSQSTKTAIGREDLPDRGDLASSMGVRTTVIKTAEISKAEEQMLQSNALTVEDNDPFFTMYEITQRNALIKPTYDPVALQTLNHQNNTLLQCVSAMEVNIDGTGYVIQPKNPTDPEETLEGEIDGEQSEESKEVIGGKKPEELEIEEVNVKEVNLEDEDEAKEKEIADRFKEPPKDEKGIIEQEKEKFVEREKGKEEDKAKQAQIKEMQDAEDEEKKGIEDFFDEPWPGMSFTTIRRKMRRDLESMGNAYLEVIRDVKGNIVFLNYLDAKLVRMVRLGKPIEVETEITRFGKTTTVKRLTRERRYAMLIGARTTISNVTKVMYFKEFGASRDLNKWNGLWSGTEEDAKGDANDAISNPAGPGPDLKPNESAGQVPGLTGLVAQGQPQDIGGDVPANQKATELIHFTALPDVVTLYGVPRWINQVPSVLGSRKAEELNLEFFNSGGLPPAMILIQGGSLSDQSRQALTGYMAGEAKHKQRGIIAELFSTTGDLTSSGNVRVSVERFGAERQQDAMFMKYDENCAKHVRMAFRLPPLFLGDSKEHNFATAKASYMVAEAQVFEPEREEFDEVVNTKIMKEIAPEWVYRSKPMSINDVEAQLEALALVSDKIEQECFVEQVGEVANLELECKKDDPDDEPDIGMEVANRMGMLQGMPGAVQNGEAGKPFEQVNVTGDAFGKIAKIDDNVIDQLATDWALHINGDQHFQDVSIEAMKQMIDCLAPAVRKVFNNYVSMKTLAGAHEDPDGTAELLGCAAHAE